MRGKTGFFTAIVLASTLLAPLSWAKNGEARFGDLQVTVERAEATLSRADGYHDMRFRVAFKNIGKQAICTSFIVRLETTLNVELTGSVRFEDKNQFDEYPSIHILLPGKSLQSEVVFGDLKEGLKPQTLVIKPLGGFEGCTREHRRVVYPARISLRNLSLQTVSETSS